MACYPRSEAGFVAGRVAPNTMLEANCPARPLSRVFAVSNADLAKPEKPYKMSESASVNSVLQGRRLNSMHDFLPAPAINDRTQTIGSLLSFPATLAAL